LCLDEEGWTRTVEAVGVRPKGHVTSFVKDQPRSVSR
jgi:hypothetical protein